MALVRRIARPLLASIYIYGGVDAFRNPAGKAPAADTLVSGMPAKLPGISSTEQLVRADGAAKVLGGVALALGKFPRLAALGLVASLVPTTVAGHPFWQEKDPAKRKMQQLQFLKNASIVGGTLLAVVDTEGKPSVGWRARRAAQALKRDAGAKAQSAGDLAHSVTDSVSSSVSNLLPTS
jgi:putative oxidoreductase